MNSCYLFKMQFELTGWIGSNQVCVEISESDFDTVVSSKGTCLFALDLEEKFALVLENYFEFESELLSLAEKSRIWRNRDHSMAMAERLLLERRLVNLLTACRLYLDQTDHEFSAHFGKISAELDAVKKFKNDLYDEYFGYRFMETLRNYVQHAGLPIHIIRYDSGIVGELSEKFCHYSISLRTKIGVLGESRIIKKTVMKELQSLGQDVDLRPFVRQYVSCFVELHTEIRGMIKSEFLTERVRFQDAVKRYSEHEGKRLNYPEFVKCDEKGQVERRVALTTRFYEYYDALRTRNEINMPLDKSFASNSDKKLSR